MKLDMDQWIRRRIHKRPRFETEGARTTFYRQLLGMHRGGQLDDFYLEVFQKALEQHSEKGEV